MYWNLYVLKPIWTETTEHKRSTQDWLEVRIDRKPKADWLQKF